MSAEPNEIDLEACRWVVLLERGPLSESQQDQFEHWQASDIRHWGAFVRAQAAARSFDQLGALAGTTTFKQAPVLVTRRRALATALSAASLAGVGAWVGIELFGSNRGRYTTAVGEGRRVMLADGSEMHLNTATDLFVRYSTAHRNVYLTKGEALFSVVRDLARPFALQIRDWLVRSTATTTFAVRGGDVDFIRVLVMRGTVEMLRVAAGGAQEPLPLPAEHEATVGSSGMIQVQPISNPELQRRLSWRSGMIVFDGEPLHDAIQEVNRYRVRPLLVEDPTLAERQIVGAFPLHDPDSFVSALQTTLGLQVLPTSHGVLLSPRMDSHH